MSSDMAPWCSEYDMEDLPNWKELKKLMKEKKVNFTDIKAKMVTEKVDGADSWDSVKDIPRLKMFEIIERMQKKKTAK